MNCTIGEALVRLDKLIDCMMCDEIHDICVKFDTVTPEKTMSSCEQETDRLVTELSKNLDNPSHCKRLLASQSPEMIFTLFMRYNLLTYTLINKNQNFSAEVPADSKEFFVTMLNDLWKLSLQ